MPGKVKDDVFLTSSGSLSVTMIKCCEAEVFFSLSDNTIIVDHKKI